VPASAVLSAAAPSPAASSASAPAPERQQKKELSPPSDELPEYTAEEIESCTRSDSGFKAVLDAAKQILGKQLARHDMSRLLGIYNHLGLSAEVIYVLLHYCAELYRGPEGAERRPTIRAIEREAFIWANRGIHTPEEAEAYVEAQKALHSSFGQIKNALEIYDRKLISSEEAYFSSWLQMGFEVDAIRLAYERTIRNTGKRALPYMNTILSRWHESGLHTAEAIEKQDPEAGRKPSSSSSGARNKPLRPFTPTDFGDLS
jgi:DnaD/phage-associated family protein